MEPEQNRVLLALVWHGGLTPLPGHGEFCGRYAMQDFYKEEEVEALVRRDLAEWQDPALPVSAVFPTADGLAEALRLIAPAEDDPVVVFVGSRRWELLVGGKESFAGLSFTRAEAAQFALELEMVAGSGLESVVLECLGGVIPAALLGDMPVHSLGAEPSLEMVTLNTRVRGLLGLGRRYRHVVEIRPTEGMATVFQWAGESPRLVGAVSVEALVGVLEHAQNAEVGLRTELREAFVLPRDEEYAE